MGSTPWVRLASTLFLVAALCASSTASAEPDPQAKAKAEALFSSAMDLSARGAYKEACENLEEAVRLTEREAIGGILELARCKDKLGLTASAWALYREVIAKAARTGQVEREAEATLGAKELEPRLHMLQLSLDPELAETPGLTIRQGRLKLGRAAWTVPAPIDPGEVVIEASAPGKRSIVRRVRIPAEPGTTRVALPSFEEPERDAVTPASAPEPRAGDTAKSGNGTRVAGLVVGGAGIATMAASGVILLMAKSQWNDAHSTECDAANACTPDGKDRIDSARSKGTIATVVFGAGAALTVTGVILYFTAPSASPERASKPRLSVGAVAWPGGGSATLGARF